MPPCNDDVARIILVLAVGYGGLFARVGVNAMQVTANTALSEERGVIMTM